MGKKIEGLEVYDDAELYDLLAASNNAIVEFYDEEARKLGGPVLELACGTGRLTIPLAQSGLEVVGIDLHPGMLARARAAAEAAHVQVEFVETDMRDFSLQKRFGLIFVAYNSLLHLLQSEDLAACFTNVARHLTPSGNFILEIVNPSPHWLALPSGERRKIGGGFHPDLGEITMEQTLDYDRSTQVSHETWFWSAPGQPDFRVRSVQMRMIYPQELQLLPRMNGLKVAERYGGYDKRPFEKDSSVQICVCGKRQQ